MLTIDSLVATAMDALITGNNLQSVVREMIMSDTKSLDTVAEAVGVFRYEAEAFINEDPDSVLARRKRVNNIVNDVSRICREITGKSIVIKSRKDGFVYTVREPKPRKETGTTEAITPREGLTADGVDELNTLRVITATAGSTIDWLLTTNDIDQVARIFVNKLRQIKAGS